jgi:hypothetical protein
MRYRLIALAFVVLLAACTTVPKPSDRPPLTAEQTDPGGFPQDYELRIISWLRMNSPDPDRLRVISIQPPQVVALDAAAPESGLEKGERVWESIVYTQSTATTAPPAVHRFHFKDGVIRAVYAK